MLDARRVVDVGDVVTLAETSIHKKDGSEIVTSYRCLPDTVDPRGPKAK